MSFRLLLRSSWLCSPVLDKDFLEEIEQLPVKAFPSVSLDVFFNSLLPFLVLCDGLHLSFLTGECVFESVLFLVLNLWKKFWDLLEAALDLLLVPESRYDSATEILSFSIIICGEVGDIESVDWKLELVLDKPSCGGEDEDELEGEEDKEDDDKEEDIENESLEMSK